jgi:hypothetical protein
LAVATTLGPKSIFLSHNYNSSNRPFSTLLQATMNTTSPASEPAPAFTIESLLEVLLLCFEAAADAFLSAPLAYVQPVAEPPKGVTSYFFWRVDDLDDPPSYDDFPLLVFPPKELPAAMPRLNYCDYFACLLEKEANRLLQKQFGAKAAWVLVAPRPTLVVYHYKHKKQALKIPYHSVLYVTANDGTEFIMDGTGEQFAWPRSSWLLPANEYFKTRVEKGIWRRTSEAAKVATKKHMEARLGYWALVPERMEGLFKELSWDTLKALPREDRVEAVKEQAQAKFADAWEEVIERAGA